MANKKNWLGVLVIMLVFGMMVVGCDDGSSDNGGGNPFVGTWNGVDSDGDTMRLVVTGSSWTATWPGINFGPYSGTYTYNGNTATLSMSGEGVVGTATVSGNTMTGMVDGLGFTLTK